MEPVDFEITIFDPNIHQYTYQHAGPWTQHAGPSRELFWTSVGVLQHTQDVRVCPSAHTGRPWLSVCVRVCPSVHTGRPWLSISTHIRMVVLGLSTLTLPVECSGDFGPRALSVQYTQDVHGCLPAHTGRLWMSVSTHRTSVAVCVCPSEHNGRPRLSISTHISTLVLGLSTLALPVNCLGDFGPCGLSVQYTHDVCGCPPAHTGRSWLTLVLGLSALALPVDCSGDYGQYGVSVQYTQDVCGCPPAHTGRLWLSVYVRQHTQVVSGCPSVHISARWFLDSARWPFPWTVRVILAYVGCLFSTHRTFVCVRQHTQDVRGCPAAHTGRSWLSGSTHRTSVAVHQYTYQHADCPWTAVQYIYQHADNTYQHAHRYATQAPDQFNNHKTMLVKKLRRIVVHTGRPCVSICTHRTSVAVRVCPCVSVCVRQHTQDIRGCPSVNISARWSLDSARWPFPWTVWVILAQVGCLFSTHKTSVGVRLHTKDVRGRTRQHTQDVRGCPSAHAGCPCVFVSTHRTSMCVRQHRQDVRGCPSGISTLVLGLSMLALPVDCLGDFGHVGCLFSTHRTSMGVRQHTQDSVAVRGCPSVHTGRPWLSVCVRVCPSAHTGRPWLSISTHISTMVLGLSTLAIHVDCLVYTGRSWVSVSTHMTSVCVRQHTQDVRGSPCVSVSTHRTSVAVHQYTYQHVGPWSQHADPSRGLFGTSVGVRQHTQDVYGCSCVSMCVRLCPSVHTGRLWLSISTHIRTLVLGLSTLALPVDFLGDFSPRGLSVQYTQDVRGCSPAHTGLLWLSVAVLQHTQDIRGCTCVSVFVRVRPSAHRRRPWLSISTHISTMVLGHSTLALPVDCSGDFGPCGLSVLYTQDVCGCPSAHTGLSCVSVSTHKTSVCVRVCLCVSISTHRTSVAVHQYTYQDDGPWTQHAGPSRGLFGTSVGIRQHTQDVRVCPSEHTGRPWLSISKHISTLVLRLSTLALPVDSLGDFGPGGLSVQYTQDVRGCPSAHKRRTRQHTQDVRGCPSAHAGCPCVFVSTHKTSMCVRQHRQDVCGCPSGISTLVLGLSMLALPVDCLGDFGPRGLSVQYTQDVHGCPPAHTGRPWLSVSTHRTSVAVCVCPCVSVSTHMTSVAVHQYTYQHDVHTGRPWVSVSTHMTSVCVRQHTQDVRGSPCVSVSTHMTSVAVHQYTYQHIGPWSQHADPSRGLFGTSVGVRQHTQDVYGCSCVSMCVRLCPSVHTGRLWLVGTEIHTVDFRLNKETRKTLISQRTRISVNYHTSSNQNTRTTTIKIRNRKESKVDLIPNLRMSVYNKV
ncbi:hypothetical protein IGI04_008754 [Brassica rapa subsp. trilocularis]|uniref:Uncharacterized protein n=1 Tax=Brassica rapa subsp. trilocularis TaxID=1813537 RepID=A0ABQ7MVI8_BRACM|nr:hypothetical protein IGI04_008754 [Brassica rapa subsp. trilocularis]